MKRFIWLVAGLMTLSAVAQAQAQFLVPVYGGPSSGSAIGFRYKSGRLDVGGFAYKGYSPGAYVVSPFPIAGPAYSPYYGYPYGAAETRVTINIYNPPTIVVAPTQGYDLSGVDLDVVRPEKAFGPGLKVNGTKEPEPPPQPKPLLEPPMPPGKDVSQPKKAIRPEDEPPPLPKEEPKPPGDGNFPKPAEPLANVRDESDRLVTLGLEAFREKAYGTAAQFFKQAGQVDASNFLAYLLLAQAEFAFPRHEQAVSAIHASMKLKNEEYPTIKFSPRVSLYKGMEAEFDDHLDQLKDAVKNNPKSPELLFLLAHQLWFDNQRDVALVLFLKARPLAADTTYIDLFLNVGKPKVVAAK